jgi:hypothetical protein
MVRESDISEKKSHCEGKWRTENDMMVKQLNEIRVLAFDICSEYGSKLDLRQITNSCVYAWLTVYLYWIWTGNMTLEIY